MTAAPDVVEPCPLCGGDLQSSVATIPFVVGASVAVIKGVPVEVCGT